MTENWSGDDSAEGLHDLKATLSCGVGELCLDSLLAFSTARVRQLPPTRVRSRCAEPAEWMEVSSKPKRAETPCFSFHVRGCRQLALDDSSFIVMASLTTILNPVEDEKPLFKATLDPMSKDCFSRELPVRSSA